MNETIQSPEELAKQTDRTVVFEEAVEAVLFAAGHPISYATLAFLCELIKDIKILRICRDLLKSCNPELNAGKFLKKLLCLLRVIPEIGRKSPFLTLSHICPFILNIYTPAESLDALLQFLNLF